MRKRKAAFMVVGEEINPFENDVTETNYNKNDVEPEVISMPDIPNPYAKDKKIVCIDTGEVCTANKYLSTKHWRQIRKDIYCMRNGNCQNCHKHLLFCAARVHHLNYNSMGKEKKTDLMLLCDECHSEIHGRESKKQKREREYIINAIKRNPDGELPPEIIEGYENLDLMDNPEKWFARETITEKATEKQITFATSIAETLGLKLPEEPTKEAYSQFISGNIELFNTVRSQLLSNRYKGDNINE